MRILQVSSLYYPELKFGGPPEKIHALSCGLVRRGHEVSVATCHSERRKQQTLDVIDDVRVQYLPWVGRGFRQWPTNLRLLSELVRQSDVVHCYGLYDFLGPIAAFFSRRFARPYLMEPLGMYLPRVNNVRAKTLYHRLFTSRMARSAAAIIAASSAERDELRPLVSDERLILRRNGVDLHSFQYLPSAKGFRDRHQLGSETRVVLFIGRISPVKNLEQLILAFQQANLRDAVLLLIGPLQDTQYALRLRDLIKERGMEKTVRLLGPMYGNDKLTALAAADIFVLPSLSESFGNSAAEAVAAGIPVLLTESCGIAPLIHGRAGLAVPVGISPLADGLHQLASIPGRCAAITSKRAAVIQELSWTEPITLTEELYAKIVHQYSP